MMKYNLLEAEKLSFDLKEFKKEIVTIRREINQVIHLGKIVAKARQLSQSGKRAKTGFGLLVLSIIFIRPVVETVLELDKIEVKSENVLSKVVDAVKALRGIRKLTDLLKKMFLKIYSYAPMAATFLAISFLIVGSVFFLLAKLVGGSELEKMFPVSRKINIIGKLILKLIAYIPKSFVDTYKLNAARFRNFFNKNKNKKEDVSEEIILQEFFNPISFIVNFVTGTTKKIGIFVIFILAVGLVIYMLKKYQPNLYKKIPFIEAIASKIMPKFKQIKAKFESDVKKEQGENTNQDEKPPQIET